MLVATFNVVIFLGLFPFVVNFSHRGCTPIKKKNYFAKGDGSPKNLKVHPFQDPSAILGPSRGILECLGSQEELFNHKTFVPKVAVLQSIWN